MVVTCLPATKLFGQNGRFGWELAPYFALEGDRRSLVIARPIV